MLYGTRIRSVSRGMQIAHVDRQVRAWGGFVKRQINRGIVRFDQRVIRRGSVCIGAILVMRQNLSRVKFGGVERKFIDGAKVRVAACSARIVVSAEGEGDVAAGGVGHVAGIRSTRSSGPDVGVRGDAV